MYWPNHIFSHFSHRVILKIIDSVINSQVLNSNIKTNLIMRQEGSIVDLVKVGFGLWVMIQSAGVYRSFPSRNYSFVYSSNIPLII